MDNLKQQIENYIAVNDISRMFFAKHDNDLQIIENIAIIQSFYGIDINRINATSSAIRYMIESNYIPKDWIFVEAQKSKDLAVFQWLQLYNIKYFFVEIPSYSENLFLKTSLWNIGLNKTNANNLCFIDSDVAFCNSNWLKSVNDAFCKYDVMSLHGYSFYELEGHTLDESIGHKFLQIKQKLLTEEIKFGHTGFTFGIKRQLLSKLNYFSSSIYQLDDVFEWTRIFGKKCNYNLKKWIPISDKTITDDGVYCEIGSTDEICCHMFHGSIENRNYDKHMKLINDLFLSNEKEIVKYDKLNCLPSLKENSIFKLIRNDMSFDEICTAQFSTNLNHNKLIDVDQLVVVTYFHQNSVCRHELIIEHYHKLLRSIGIGFTYVVLTDNYKNIYNDKINIIQIKQQLNNINFNSIKTLIQKYIIIDEKTSFLFIPLNYTVPNKLVLVSIDDDKYVDDNLIYFSNIKFADKFQTPINFFIKQLN